MEQRQGQTIGLINVLFMFDIHDFGSAVAEPLVIAGIAVVWLGLVQGQERVAKHFFRKRYMHWDLFGPKRRFTIALSVASWLTFVGILTLVYAVIWPHSAETVELVLTAGIVSGVVGTLFFVFLERAKERFS